MYDTVLPCCLADAPSIDQRSQTLSHKCVCVCVYMYLSLLHHTRAFEFF